MIETPELDKTIAMLKGGGACDLSGINPQNIVKGVLQHYEKENKTIEDLEVIYANILFGLFHIYPGEKWPDPSKTRIENCEGSLAVINEMFANPDFLIGGSVSFHEDDDDTVDISYWKMKEDIEILECENKIIQDYE